MKKALAILGMLLPFFFWILWIISALLLNEVPIETTNIMINLLYIKTFSGIGFLLWVVTMLVSIIYVWREKWLTQSEIIKPSWKLARKNVWKYALWIVLVFILQIFQSELSDPSRPTTLFVSVLIIVFGVLYIRIDFGLKKLSLAIIQEKKSRAVDIFVDPEKFLKYLIAYIITWIAIFVWIILFIIPWILVALRLNMVPYLILEENLGPWQAIKRSWKITKHKAANLFALNIIIGVVNILWLLALFVGLFWTLPLFYLANAMFFTKLLSLEK